MAESVPAEVRAARLATARLATERRRVVAAGTRAGGLDRGRLQEIDDRIGGLLDEVLAHVDPLDASEAEPLVLLPVRLETRFAQVGAAATLKVRIYPDEVHVDSLERGLTADERTAGQAWWTAAWAGADEAAFARLVDVVGAARAEWVAHACTPRNLAERASGAPPDFPDTAEPGLPRTVARALPDRFVVVAVQGGQVSRAVGRPVPRDLQVSPVPTGDELPVDAAGGLVVPPGSEWLVDFDAATARRDGRDRHARRRQPHRGPAGRAGHPVQPGRGRRRRRARGPADRAPVHRRPRAAGPGHPDEQLRRRPVAVPAAAHAGRPRGGRRPRPGPTRTPAPRPASSGSTPRC